MRQSGFTLIELLTVLTLIAILTASAVPQFAAYRRKAFDVRAQSDLRNVATAEEAYFIDYERYEPCADDACRLLPGIAALSKGVSLAIEAVDGDDAFTGTSRHEKGTGRIFVWDSSRGGFIED